MGGYILELATFGCCIFHLICMNFDRFRNGLCCSILTNSTCFLPPELLISDLLLNENWSFWPGNVLTNRYIYYNIMILQLNFNFERATTWRMHASAMAPCPEFSQHISCMCMRFCIYQNFGTLRAPYSSSCRGLLYRTMHLRLFKYLIIN